MKLTSPEQMTGNNSYKTAANNLSLKSNYNLSDPFREGIQKNRFF